LFWIKYNAKSQQLLSLLEWICGSLDFRMMYCTWSKKLICIFNTLIFSGEPEYIPSIKYIKKCRLLTKIIHLNYLFLISGQRQVENHIFFELAIFSSIQYLIKVVNQDWGGIQYCIWLCLVALFSRIDWSCVLHPGTASRNIVALCPTDFPTLCGFCKHM
jgi:hypothetical protein